MRSQLVDMEVSTSEEFVDDNVYVAERKHATIDRKFVLRSHRGY